MILPATLLLCALIAAGVGWLILRNRADILLAARAGRADRVRRLLDRDPGLLRAADPHGETAVHHAAKYGRADVLRLLLDRGGDVNARTPDGITPLHVAAAFGEPDAVRLLLERGADVEAVEKRGITPFMAAQMGGRADVLRLLQDAGASDPFPGLRLPIAADDPLMAEARRKARESVPVLLDLFKSRPFHAHVKLPAGGGGTAPERVWCDLVAVEGDRLRVRPRATPAPPPGEAASEREAALSEIEDWQVEMKDGTIRGGYTHRVIARRYRERHGSIPPAWERALERLVDG